MIASILTQDQANDMNLAASVKQWIFQNVVGPYNAKSASLSINQGMQLQSDGLWVNDGLGLQILYADPTDDSLYEHVPSIGYIIDNKPSSKDPIPTGAGDVANWEYRTINMTCLPAIESGSDGGFESDRKSQFWLKTYVSNATLRTKILPIVDSSMLENDGITMPQIGYAEVTKVSFSTSSKDVEAILDTHRLRFDVDMEVRWAVAGTN